MKKQYIGYYNKDGYRIEEVEGYDVYTAGNSPYDSQQSSFNALPIETLKEFCQQTGEDIAEENDGEFLGVEYEEPDARDGENKIVEILFHDISYYYNDGQDMPEHEQ